MKDLSETEHRRTAGIGYLQPGTKIIFQGELPDGGTEWIHGEIDAVVEDMVISFYEVTCDQGYIHRVPLRGVWVQHNPKV